MSVNVTPGPVPKDRSTLTLPTQIESLVNGTQFTNVGPAEFDADFSAVYSQTDAPTIARGRLWFRRGEGQLYIGEEADHSSGVTNFGGSRLVWVGVAPRKEMLAVASEAFSRYSILGLANPRIGGQMAYGASNYNPGGIYDATYAILVGSYDNLPDHHNYTAPAKKVFIATETGTTHSVLAVVVRGFFNALNADPGGGVINGLELCVKTYGLGNYGSGADNHVKKMAAQTIGNPGWLGWCRDKNASLSPSPIKIYISHSPGAFL